MCLDIEQQNAELLTQSAVWREVLNLLQITGSAAFSHQVVGENDAIAPHRIASLGNPRRILLKRWLFCSSVTLCW
eukprot:m.314162 g.314162  ORF g.314162 m.314162 type:complete len:75 (+) comp55416_c0_seq30:415-639(+)